MVIFMMAMATFGLNGANAYGQDMHRADYRAVAGMDRLGEVWQVAVAFKIRPPRRLRMDRLELAVDAMSTPEENHGMLSFGPVWQLLSGGRRWFVDIGISPTLLSGSTFNGRNIGGIFHSSATAGTRLGARGGVVVGLRLQHSSNAGIDRPNPGMGMICPNVSVDLRGG